MRIDWIPSEKNEEIFGGGGEEDLFKCIKEVCRVFVCKRLPRARAVGGGGEVESKIFFTMSVQSVQRESTKL